jgi:hypothetical protein
MLAPTQTYDSLSALTEGAARAAPRAPPARRLHARVRRRAGGSRLVAAIPSGWPLREQNTVYRQSILRHAEVPVRERPDQPPLKPYEVLRHCIGGVVWPNNGRSGLGAPVVLHPDRTCGIAAPLKCAELETRRVVTQPEPRSFDQLPPVAPRCVNRDGSGVTDIQLAKRGRIQAYNRTPPVHAVSALAPHLDARAARTHKPVNASGSVTAGLSHIAQIPRPPKTPKSDPGTNGGSAS